MKKFIKEAKDRNQNNSDVLKVIEEIESETTMDSRILGTLLTLSLCMDVKL